jgi:ATP-dependent Clp protease ATP-binding subunit ClpC
MVKRRDMFERFTDKSRRVMVLAQAEARSLDQDVIGSEHLLLALTQVEGVASSVLTTFNVTTEFVRAAVVRARPASKNPPTTPPFTPNAKKTLEFALREALSLGHSYIGTEHLLLGILRNDSCAAITLLNTKGLDLVELRATLLRQAGPPSYNRATPLFEGLREIGRKIRPDLSDDELNVRIKEIIEIITTDSTSLWTAPLSQ